MSFDCLKELTTQEIRKYVNHIRTNANDPVMQRVIQGDSSFKKEFEQFYGFKSKVINLPRCMSINEVELEENEGHKIGQRPKELTKLLQGFSSDTLEDLSYELVREDICRYHNERNMGIATAFISLLGLGVIAVGVYYDFSIPLILTGAVTQFPHFYCIFRNSKSDVQTAFLELYKTAEFADLFMKDYPVLDEIVGEIEK